MNVCKSLNIPNLFSLGKTWHVSGVNCFSVWVFWGQISGLVHTPPQRLSTFELRNESRAIFFSLFLFLPQWEKSWTMWFLLFSSWWAVSWLLAADQGIVHLDCRSNSKINAAEGTISKGYFQSPSAIYPLYRGGESLSQRPGQVVIFGRSSLYLLRHLVEGSWLVTQSPEVSFCQGWWQHLRQRELAGGGLPAGVLRAALAYRVGSFPPLAPWLSKIKISSAVCQFAIMSQIWIWVFLRLRLAAGVVMRVIISHWAFFHTPCHSHLGFTRLLLLLAPFNRMESLRLQEETHPRFI